MTAMQSLTTLTVIADERRGYDGVSQQDMTIATALASGLYDTRIVCASARQIDVPGDDAIHVPPVAQEKSAGVVEAKTFSG